MPAARSAEGRAPEARTRLAQALALAHRGEYAALQALSAVLDASRTADDDGGVVLAAAAALFTGHALFSYRRFGEFAAMLEPYREGAVTFDALDDRLVAETGSLCAFLFVSPNDPRVDTCAERIVGLLERGGEPNLRYAAGRLMLYYAGPREQQVLAQRIYALLEPSAADPTLTPHSRARWLTMWIRQTADMKDPALHRRAQDDAARLAERTGDGELRTFLAGAEFNRCWNAADVDGCDRAVRAIEAASDPGNPFVAGRLEWYRARYALMRGAGDEALFHAARSRENAEQLEVPRPMLAVRVAVEAHARLLIGDYAGARDGFARTASMAAGQHAEEMRDMVRMVDASQALRERTPNADALLAHAFAGPRARQYYDCFTTNPRFGATMCAIALEHGVETEFARRIVEMHRMAAPPEAGPAWPWPLSIRAFGRFDLLRGGVAMALRDKAQKKPLDLLKALVACGGRAADKSRLADFLWPDAEAGAATASLDMAVSRLRKVLGVPDALAIVDGKVDLDPGLVWLDTWAFDRDVEALQSILHGPGDPDDAQIADLVARLVAAYRGHFLEHDEPARWMLGPRDRWRSRFLRSLSDAGRHWERRSRWDAAIAVYERGIEVDALAEDLYRRLMRARLARGEQAEAARTYLRCRDALDGALGIAPSAETQALYRSIAGAR